MNKKNLTNISGIKEELDALKALNLDRRPCIYVIRSNGEALYVGATRDLLQRMYCHHRTDEIIEFDNLSLHIVPTDVENLHLRELEWCKREKPLLNYKIVGIGAVDRREKGYYHKQNNLFR